MKENASHCEHILEIRNGYFLVLSSCLQSLISHMNHECINKLSPS